MISCRALADVAAELGFTPAEFDRMWAEHVALTALIETEGRRLCLKGPRFDAFALAMLAAYQMGERSVPVPGETRH